MDKPQGLLTELEQALAALAEERGEELAEAIRPILHANHERGRVESFVEGKLESVGAYVRRVSDHYERFAPYVRKLQIEKDEGVWEALADKLGMWAYSYFLGINFVPGEATMRIAQDRATDAAAKILYAHFPYDTDFDSWARVLLRNTCRTHVRQATRKSKIPAEKLTALDEISHRLSRKSSRNPEMQSERKLDLLSAIGELTDARKEAILNLYFKGLSPAETADHMGKSVGAVYSLHFHALNDLRKILDENRNKYE